MFYPEIYSICAYCGRRRIRMPEGLIHFHQGDCGKGIAGIEGMRGPISEADVADQVHIGRDGQPFREKAQEIELVVQVSIFPAFSC